MWLLFQYNVACGYCFSKMHTPLILLIKRDMVVCGYLHDNIHAHTNIHTGLAVLYNALINPSA